MKMDRKHAASKKDMHTMADKLEKKARNCRTHAVVQPKDSPQKHLLIAEKYEKRAAGLRQLASMQR